jgi:glycerol-3-phosphate acyltransferase PlsX
VVNGPTLLKEAASILLKLPPQFSGVCVFVCVCVGGGGNLTRGNIDVSVTDVFTGNVAIKMGEGVIRLIFDALKWGFSSSWPGKLEYLITKLIFESLKCQLDLQK